MSSFDAANRPRVGIWIASLPKAVKVKTADEDGKKTRVYPDTAARTPSMNALMADLGIPAGRLADSPDEAGKMLIHGIVLVEAGFVFDSAHLLSRFEEEQR
eukprot:5429514-Pyramimonas_sp.AAC.1